MVYCISLSGYDQMNEFHLCFAESGSFQADQLIINFENNIPVAMRLRSVHNNIFEEFRAS